MSDLVAVRLLTPLGAVPRWRADVLIDRVPLTEAHLDGLLTGLLQFSAMDEDQQAIFGPTAAPQLSGHTTAAGAEVACTLYAVDAHWAEERAEIAVRRLLERLRREFDYRKPEVVATATLLSGEVHPRDAYRLHVGSALANLSGPLNRLEGARRQVEIALKYADKIGQHKGGLEALLSDIDALYKLTHDASVPLIQRLAELETGTRG